MNTNTKQTAAPMVFPEGEFTVKAMMNSTGKSQPFVYLSVKKAIETGAIKELRRESKGKGRPTVIYSKV